MIQKYFFLCQLIHIFFQLIFCQTKLLLRISDLCSHRKLSISDPEFQKIFFPVTSIPQFFFVRRIGYYNIQRRIVLIKDCFFPEFFLLDLFAFLSKIFCIFINTKFFVFFLFLIAVHAVHNGKHQHTEYGRNISAQSC